MADPVSWKVVESGWKVVADDGTELGSIAEIVGDVNIDIFNGVLVSPGVLRSSRYVPSERVGEIREGVVELTIGADAFESLDETPPSAGS